MICCIDWTCFWRKVDFRTSHCKSSWCMHGEKIHAYGMCKLEQYCGRSRCTVNLWLHKACHAQQPISKIIKHEFITPPAISTLGDSSLSQNGQSIFALSNFHTLYKRDHCSPKSKSFSHFVGVIIYDRWDLQPFKHMQISRKFVTVFIWQTFFFPTFLRHLVVIIPKARSPTFLQLLTKFVP